MKQKLTMYSTETASVQERFDQFLSALSARGLSPRTMKTYRQHLHCISKHLDITAPLSSLRKSDLECMVSSMRNQGLANNSISSYVRAFKSFLTWCNEEGYSALSMPTFKQKDTVKETYSDAELVKLLEKPTSKCNFCEYRNWVIIQFLLNSGCRAATVRNVQNRDVDLDSKQVVFRHTKNGKVQMIPLCSSLVLRLRDYMRTRGGAEDGYLFCDVNMARCSPRTLCGSLLPITTVPEGFLKPPSICSVIPLHGSISLTVAATPLRFKNCWVILLLK